MWGSKAAEKDEENELEWHENEDDGGHNRCFK